MRTVFLTPNVRKGEETQVIDSIIPRVRLANNLPQRVTIHGGTFCQLSSLFRNSVPIFPGFPHGTVSASGKASARVGPQTEDANMTRKDYVAIAAVLRKRVDRLPDQGTTLEQRVRLAEVLEIAYRIADVFQRDNPRFDEDRFLKACGLQS